MLQKTTLLSFNVVGFLYTVVFSNTISIISLL